MVGYKRRWKNHNPNPPVLAIRIFGELDRLAHRTQIRFSGVSVSFIGSCCCSSHLGLLLFSCCYYFFFLILLLLLFSQDLALRTWVSGLRPTESTWQRPLMGRNALLDGWIKMQNCRVRFTETKSNFAVERCVGQTDATSDFIYKI